MLKTKEKMPVRKKNLRCQKEKNIVGEPKKEELDILLKKLSNGESSIQVPAIEPDKQKSIPLKKQPKR